MKKNVLFNWSGGKDSSLALYYLKKNKEYTITHLLTTINKKFQRVTMHGVRVELLNKQAELLNIPITKIELPENTNMELYEQEMRKTLELIKNTGVTCVAFGDIFLEDLKKYREEKLAELQLKALFPLWNTNTTQLANEFIQLGFKSIITCVNENFLDQSFVGRIYDFDFLNDLPPTVDPCGENGEFHTFVFDGPLFKTPILFNKGQVVYKTYPAPKNDNQQTTDKFGFWFCDLIPK
jgi:uncharacterized protein (TIGR00290 family)